MSIIESLTQEMRDLYQVNHRLKKELATLPAADTILHCEQIRQNRSRIHLIEHVLSHIMSN